MSGQDIGSVHPVYTYSPEGDVEWVYPVYSYTITVVVIVNGVKGEPQTFTEFFVFREATAWTDEDKSREWRLALVIELVRRRYPADGRVVVIQPKEIRFFCWAQPDQRLNDENIALWGPSEFPKPLPF